MVGSFDSAQDDASASLSMKGQSALPPSLFYFAGGYVETSYGGQGDG